MNNLIRKQVIESLEYRLFLESSNFVYLLIGFGGDMSKRKRILMKAKKRDERRFRKLLASIN